MYVLYLMQIENNYSNGRYLRRKNTVLDVSNNFFLKQKSEDDNMITSFEICVIVTTHTGKA